MNQKASSTKLLIRNIRKTKKTRRNLLFDQSNSNFHTVHTAHDTAPQDRSQPQPTHPGRTPHAVGHGLILLMMGIMMPEHVEIESLIINIELVASCWFFLCTLFSFQWSSKYHMVESVDLRSHSVFHLRDGYAACIQNSRARLMQAVCLRDFRFKLQFFQP